jgi:hypothetical protein
VETALTELTRKATVAVAAEAVDLALGVEEVEAVDLALAPQLAIPWVVKVALEEDTLPS